MNPRTPVTPQQAADELLRRRRARESFLGFARYMQPEDQQPALHHQLLCNELDAVARGECDSLMVCMPPGSAKSSYTSVLFPPYLLGRNPEALVIAGSHTLDLVEGFGRRARNHVNDAPYRALFPESRLADDSQAAGRWSLTQGGGYYACGVGGSVTGRRGDYVLVDDPVASREDADSPRMRDRTWDWWVNDVMPRLRPDGRRVIVLTRWHEDDLAGRLLDREAGRWKVIKLPMVAGQSDPLGRKPGEWLWPEWFTHKMIEDAQRDARAWTSLYQQDPRPPAGAEMQRSWLCRYDDWPPTANRVILVDPSGGKKRGGKPAGDRTSMWVVALGADNNAYVVDGVRARLNLSERINVLFELHHKWKPLQVRYEEYGMQADIEAAKAEMERRQYRFRIYPVGGQVSKPDRIRRLIPWFEGGRIWFPREMVRTDERGVLRDIIEDTVQEEYLPFPVGRYDDALDNLARLAEPATAELPGLPWPKAGAQTESPPSPAWAVLDELMGY